MCSPSEDAASPFPAPGSSLQGAQGPVYFLTFPHIYPHLFQPPCLRQNSCKSGCIFLSATDKVSSAGGRQIAEQFAYGLFWDISKNKACISLLKERTLFMCNRFILKGSWCEILLFSVFREGNPCPVDLSKNNPDLIRPQQGPTASPPPRPPPPNPNAFPLLPETRLCLQIQGGGWTCMSLGIQSYLCYWKELSAHRFYKFHGTIFGRQHNKCEAVRMLVFLWQKEERREERQNIVYFREKSRLSPQNLNIILKLPFFTIAPKAYQKQEPALHFYL